ncbi:hypothetical protein IQ03_03518 [Gemmobacter caeni]|uniref:Head-tail joining protein n=1 Tax=Gemmobacter caeni TaxID=589035 RepID=A0A2T6AT42_9RHOB|nr:hypothetical protein [Gemmobacter caeni]PTX46985.1 hypothetical protein C8N34_1145 [Gemmobacter caeni]TWI96158.1 hypothetical protein IQ03_03518 [Gemmobacter caeni]
MDWRERAQAMAEARAQVHEIYKIPVMLTTDNGVSWRVVFCRLHESVNPDGQTVGSQNSRITVDTDTPVAIFRHAEAPDLKANDIVSVSEGVAYKVASAAPPDRYGYRNVRLKHDHSGVARPVPDWETL